MQHKVVLYQTNGGDISVDVFLRENTLWLSLKQISELFERDRSVIGKHLKNIFKEGELEENSVRANFAITASDGKIYQVDHYNLDAILSIGYRVNSKRGTEFRQWSSRVLKDYMMNGYALNQKLLFENVVKTKYLIDLLSRTLTSNCFIDEIGVDILDIIRSYAKTWDILLRYDENQLSVISREEKCFHSLPYEEVCSAINTLRQNLQTSSLFGQERNHALKAILGNLEQTFDNVPLYSSYEEKAAHLLYFVIKDHPFSDGNKRIGCLLFLLYLQKAGHPLSTISNNTLIALALLVAESDPSQKNITIELIKSLIR